MHEDARISFRSVEKPGAHRHPTLVGGRRAPKLAAPPFHALLSRRLPRRPMISAADLQTLSAATLQLYAPDLQPGNWLDHAFKFLSTLTSSDQINYGNLDPAICYAPWPVVEAEVRDVLARNNAHPGHVFNLGHGVQPEMDPAILERVVELVHREGRVAPLEG